MILYIKDIGLNIKIPGIKEVRTPAKIDIGNTDLNMIAGYLRSLGVNKYSIISGGVEIDPDSYKSNIVKEITKEKETTIIEKTTIGSDPDVLNKLTSIERILKDLYELGIVPSNNTVRYSDNKISKSTVEVEEDDEFIPELKLDGMIQKGLLTTPAKLDKDVDIEELAKTLSELW